MSVVLASYVKMSTLVDGTMRVVLDIEPSAAADAFRLLGSPGTPIAIARITNEAAQKASQAPVEKKPLSLASKAALKCKERSFQQFLSQKRPTAWRHAMATTPATEDLEETRENLATETVKMLCDVKSRSEIVDGSLAERIWLSLEADYLDWQRSAV
jgi:hypothetical protein